MTLELLFVILAGFLNGIVAALFGIGGGAVTVPFLDSLFSLQGVDAALRFKLVVGTSMSVIVPTSLVSMWRHSTKGRVLWPQALWWMLGGLVGGLAATFLVQRLDSQMLSTGFYVFLFLVALRLVLFKPPKGEVAPPSKSFLVPFVTGALVASLSAMLGVGGGLIGIPVMILLLRYPPAQLAGTSNAFTGAVALAATIGYALASAPGLPAGTTGYVWWPYTLALAAGSIPGAVVGAAMLHRSKADRFRYFFAALLFVVAGEALVSKFLS